MGMRLRQTESMPEPDLFWVKTKHKGRPTAEVVPLVIELVASTLRYDRIRKSRLYALDGIAEYWIVEVSEQRIEVRTEPEGEEYQRLEVFNRNSQPISPRCLPEASLDIDRLFGLCDD